jgi:hypothetical protein
MKSPTVSTAYLTVALCFKTGAAQNPPVPRHARVDVFVNTPVVVAVVLSLEVYYFVIIHYFT